MTARTYGQFCALARALDVVGERWNLLVVRELLTGPQRYTDLLNGLPGISTDVLAARLATLEEAGVVSRRVLPPPAASKVYELTPEGHDLEPVLLALAAWGRRRLGPELDGEFRTHWLVLSLRSQFRPDAAAGVAVTVDFAVGRGRLRARIEDGALRFDTAPDDDDADVVVTADPATLASTDNDPDARARALQDGTLRLEGDPEKLATVQAAFAG